MLGHPLMATKRLRRRRLPCLNIISGARLPDDACFPTAAPRADVEFDEGQAAEQYKVYAQHMLVLFKPFRQPEDLYGGAPLAPVTDRQWTDAFKAFDASPALCEGLPLTRGRRYKLNAQDYYVVQREANRKAQETRAAIAEAYPTSATAAAPDELLYENDRGDDDDAEGVAGQERRDEPDANERALYDEAAQLMLSEAFSAHEELKWRGGRLLAVLATPASRSPC